MPENLKPWTQEEIAEQIGIHKDTVNEICSKSAELPESNKPAANHLIDFEVPLYNVWKKLPMQLDVMKKQ